MLGNWVSARRGYLSGWKRRLARRRGIRVFRYHGVVLEKKDRVLERNFHLLSVLEAQADYLGRFRVLRLAELADALDSRQRGKRPEAVVTFDDAMENNVIAADVFARRRIPWSVFVPSGEIGPGQTMWSLEVSLLVIRGRATRLELFDRDWPLGSRREREKTFGALRSRLKSLSAESRLRAMFALRAQFPSGESDRLLAEFPSLRTMTREQVLQLSSAGVEIGSHGRHHEIHHARQPADVRAAELGQSREELTSLLGSPCRWFAFPNGDFLPESAREVERAGYELGFTTASATLDGKTRDDRFLLPRLAAPSSLHSFVRAVWWEPTAAADFGGVAAHLAAEP